MNRIASSRSIIKLLLVIAMCLALSCVTAPGIRTADVAELHYGDREELVVEKLGEGSEILYFVLDGKKYRFRLYATIYTKDVYTLLFVDGELIAVHDVKQDFSECLNLEEGAPWGQCVSKKLSEMRFHDIKLETHDFSHGIQTEQKEQSKRDRSRAGAAAIAIPLTFVLPGFVPTVCAGTCGGACRDPGEMSGDYDPQDYCIDKMSSTLGQAINILHGNITYESIDKALGQIQHHKKIIYYGAIDEKTIDENAVISYSWGCVDSYPYPRLSIKLGLTDGLLKWSWFKLGADIKNKENHNAWKLSKEIGAYCPNADLGHADAQTHVGDLYYLGSYDLEKNLIQAFVWYSLAETNGNLYASGQLNQLRKKLSTQQLSEAHAQLEEWKPGQCERYLMEAITEETEPVEIINQQYPTAESLVWLCRAVDEGDIAAQFNLGRIYWSRGDIPDNRAKSFVWYMLAAKPALSDQQNRNESIRKRAAIEVEYKRDKILNNEQLKKAMQLYSDWPQGQCEYDLAPEMSVK